MVKRIPIGVDDFKKIRSDNYFYIDKTKFIEEIINDDAEVQLFTRPRRFGKSLNLSMLKSFFDIRECIENRNLFDGLYIKDSPVFVEQGTCPVIFISFKGLIADTIEELVDALTLKISNQFSQYRDLISSLDRFDAIVFEKFILRQDISHAEVKESLLILSQILYRYYKRKVVVLIDEYDAPLIHAYARGYYTDAITLFKTLYGNVLKGNSSTLKMGVLTGAIRVAQAGIFSDLNNIKINTILNKDFDEYFGLSQDEVENALKAFKLDYQIEEVREWYNGYRFGTVHVYNPWSIVNYIGQNELKPYWVNTSGNILIKELLQHSDETVFNQLDNMVKGQDKTVYINESIALGNNLNPNSLWELLLFSGYLTVKERVDPESYLVKIPNKEIRSFFKSLFADIVFDGSNNIASIKDALQSKDIRTIISILEKVVLNALSFYDTSKNIENPYQTLLSGFLYALDNYYNIKPNQESGYGRADIILVPRNKTWPGYILELKRAKTNNLEKEADMALEQINNKSYDALLISEGIKTIVKIGLVFDGKRTAASY